MFKRLNFLGAEKKTNEKDYNKLFIIFLLFLSKVPPDIE